MNNTGFKAAVQAVIEQYNIDDSCEREFYYYGVRFEAKSRQVDEVIEDFSRNNVDREDERDFPEFGTEAYENSDVFDGVSAWNIDGDISNSIKRCDSDTSTHCYIVASDMISNADDGLDYNEIVLVDAKVLAVIF